MSNRHGVTFVRINDVNYSARNVGTINFKNEQAEAVVNKTGGTDFKYTGRAPSVKGLEISVGKDDDPTIIGSLDNVSVQMGFRDGKVAQLNSATVTSDGDFNAEEGTIELDLEGESGVWLV